MPKRKRSTPRKRSVHATPRKVTHLFDPQIPVALRLSGFHHILPSKEATVVETLTFQTQERTASPHVLELREDVQATEPLVIEETISTEAPSSTFETFVETFEAEVEEHLTPEPTTSQPEAEIQDWHLDLEALKRQLQENDLTETLAAIPVQTAKPKKTRTIRNPFQRTRTKSKDTCPAPRPRVIHQFRAIEQRLHPVTRNVLAFVMLSFVFVLPLQAMQTARSIGETKNTVLHESQEAINALKSVDLEGGDIAGAKNALTQANSSFEAADEALQSLGPLGSLASLLPGDHPAKYANDILTLGQELTTGGAFLSDGFSAMSSTVSPDLVTKMAILDQHVERALPHLQKANTILGSLPIEELDTESGGALSQLSTILPGLISDLESYHEFADAFLFILGENEKKRYLIVFQNHTEIRPTGGFIGSFAEVEIHRGEIADIRLPADGSYNLQGALKTNVLAPEPMQLINARWEFQDANWFPDFPSSAKKMLWFYEDAGEPTVDGVISINASWVVELLGLVGPIEMPEYDLVVDQENFLFETQRLVEIDYDKEANTPKQFLTDLAPKLLERLNELESESMLDALQAINNGLESRDIQLYFTDHDVQNDLSELGWTGELTDTPGDYLMVVNTNIGGQKTDAVIDEDVYLHSRVMDNGTIRNTVTVNRTHTGIQSALFTGANNVNFTRIYVPRGSKLVEIAGMEPPKDWQFEQPEPSFIPDEDISFFEANQFIDPVSKTIIGEEFGKTVFGNWTQTNPGETSSLQFVYDLPIQYPEAKHDRTWTDHLERFVSPATINDHSLTIDPQSGAINRTTHVTIELPSGNMPFWSTHPLNAGRVETTLQKTESGFISLLFE